MSAETNDLNALIGRALDQLSGEDVIRPTRVATVVMEWLDPMSVARRRAQTRSAAAAAEGREAVADDLRFRCPRSPSAHHGVPARVWRPVWRGAHPGRPGRACGLIGNFQIRRLLCELALWSLPSSVRQRPI